MECPGRGSGHLDSASLVLDEKAAASARLAQWDRDGIVFPMEAIIDQAGRIVLPELLRDALGLLPGTKVDILAYRAGAQLIPAGRTAQLVEENGVLVAAGETPIDDDVVFALTGAGRG
jgi:hypothetical protein